MVLVIISFPTKNVTFYGEQKRQKWHEYMIELKSQQSNYFFYLLELQYHYIPLLKKI